MGKSWQWALFGVCLILGVLLTLQLKSERKIRVSLPTRRVNELATMLKERENKRKLLEEELLSARSENASYIDDPEVLRLQTLLGLTPVEGPGLLVTLNDSNRQPVKGQDAMELLVHYDDLSIVVNELWSAGAEAIAINGERVVMDSGLSCAGTTILLNTRRIAAPYIVKAIGDPETLEKSMESGITDVFKYRELDVSLSQQERVAVPAYKGSFQQNYVTAERHVSKKL